MRSPAQAAELFAHTAARSMNDKLSAENELLKGLVRGGRV